MRRFENDVNQGQPGSGWRMATLGGITVIVCMQVASCVPTAREQTAGNDQRLQVTDTLRDACEAFGLNDTAIDLLIQVAEEDRLAGVSLDQNLADTVESCQTSSEPARAQACETCSVAIIEQVYGE